MENLILQKRKMVQSRIEKSFESGLQISELQCIEKAHNVGDVHPNGKWVWTEIRPGKFDWRVKKNSNSNGSKKGSAPQSSGKQATTEFNRQQLQQSSKQFASSKKYDADVMEHVDELVKKIGKDKALERFERYIKEYGDDGTKFGAMMKYKYSQAAEYLKGKAESDFKKTFKDARDEVLQQVVSGKIQASADERKWAKDIIDERKKSEKSAVKIDETTIDQSEYDSQLKMAKQVGDQARSMAKNLIQGNIDKTKKKLQETISSRPGAKATIAAFQKDLTKFVSQKKAVEDADAIAARNGANKRQSYASMDIKDAKKALIGKTVTLTDYWPDGRGGSQDAIGEIKNVRLYGKNKTPIAEVVYPNGDEQDIRLDEIDDGKMKDSYKTPITISDNKTAQKPKSAAKTFADKIMERAKDGRWVGSLSDDEKKKLEDNIKNDKASINDLLLAKFPAATAYPGFSSEEKSEMQLANGKMLKLVHSASIRSNRMGQEYTKHEYQITDLYGKVVYGSSQSTKGYTTPAQAKRETIDQALYSLFAKK